MTRFLQASVFAFSSALAACAGISGGDVPPSPEGTASNTAELSFDATPRICADLLSGRSALPPAAASVVHQGCLEDALARNPRTHLDERKPATVSMARHQEAALAHYRDALQLLGDEGSPFVRRRLQARIQSLLLSIEALDGLNERLALSCDI